MSRIFIFTGKGGVGKTSVAAAHAIKSAGEGKKTLLVSTDMAHNLGDLFERKLGKEPEAITEYLDAYEISPDYVMEEDYKDMVEGLTKLLPKSADSCIENFGMLPGMEELFSLLKINDIYKENRYERIIVDCAPTGETLSLLKFPELLSWYMEKLFPVGKVAMRVMKPIAKAIYKLELPNKAAMNDIEKLYLKLYELQELFKNREVTSIRLVSLPEKMVVEETKRNYMYMNLYNFNVDGLYINRLLPKDMNNPFFEEWLTIQNKYRDELCDSFSAVPIYEIPWYDEELKGMRAVKRICKDALMNQEVFEAKTITQRELFEQTDTGYTLKLFLPFVEKKEVELFQSQNNVVVKIGNFKRNIPLPNVLRTYQITSARFQERELLLQFEKGEHEDE